MIIAFEGIDGAGKNTLVSAVEQELLAREIPLARLAFPRYEFSSFAEIAQDALFGRFGDLTDSINGMALLFALDRADAAIDLREFSDDGYVVLLDRYVASNAAYSAARAFQRAVAASDSDAEAEAAATGAASAMVEWVEELEIDRLGVPVPDLQILLRLDAGTAAERVSTRADSGAGERDRDSYEADAQLQDLTAQCYAALAGDEWLSEWVVVDSVDGGVAELAAEIVDLIVAAMDDSDAEVDADADADADVDADADAGSENDR